tara:strand:- start:794 stop:1201 length:408 start_codon:yes stop_codon:yes gene_type:complete
MDIMKFLFILINLILLNNIALATEPHNDDLTGKNLICFNDSYSIDDWGVKFLKDKIVILYSLDKSMYEIYQYKRKYRTDLRNILITKDKIIEFIINRSRLILSNKKCKLVNGDPLILLQNRIKFLRTEKKEGNKI